MKTIVCLGDSITSNQTEPSYVDCWQQLNPDNRFIGAGVNGETAWDGLRRVDQDVLRYKPDLVAICFGHNEVFQGVPVLEYQQALVRLIDAIHRADCQVWLLTPTQLADEAMTNQYVPYLEVLPRVAAQYACHLVDLWHVFAGQRLETIFTYTFDYDGLTGRDFVHPNYVGMNIIAHKLHNEYILIYQSNK